MTLKGCKEFIVLLKQLSHVFSKCRCPANVFLFNEVAGLETRHLKEEV